MELEIRPERVAKGETRIWGRRRDSSLRRVLVALVADSLNSPTITLLSKAHSGVKKNPATCSRPPCKS